MESDVKRRVRTRPASRGDNAAWYQRGMERLVTVVQELSLARELATVIAIADEDAIAPLWKGRGGSP